MRNLIRSALAAGLAAALALFGNAQAQSSAAGSSDSSASGGAAGGAGGQTTTSSPPGTRSGDTGQTQSGQAGGTAAGSQAQAGQQVDKGLQEKLEKIHAANEAEVQLAQMAAAKAESPEVKQFAEQLQADHQGLGQKLTQAAQSAGIPSLEGKAYEKEHERKMKDVEKVQSTSGADYDKAFMSRIVKDHEKNVKATESAAKDARKANQTELASFLENASSGMKGHLAHAKQLEKELGQRGEQMRQGRRPPPTGTGYGAPESGAQQPGQQQSR